MILKELFAVFEDITPEYVRDLLKDAGDETRVIKREGDASLWYATDNHFEAFVVEEANGKLSFYDEVTKTRYHKNRLMFDHFDSEILDDIVEEYNLESSNPKDGVIAALLSAYGGSGQKDPLSKLTDNPEVRKKLQDRTRTKD